MITIWVFVIVALFALGLLVYFATRARRHPTDIEDATSVIRSIDIEAFRNLVDPAEEAFLRSNLAPKKFREIKRERAWAALAYVRSAGRAAVLFTEIGQAAQRSSDPKIAASGTQIADSALRLRLYTLQAHVRLLTAATLPGVRNLSLPPLIDHYERTAETLLRLRRLRSGQSADF